MGKRKKSTKQPQQNERRYAGAVINRLNSDWIAQSTSADSEIWSSLRILRDRSRSLCRDNDYAIGAIRTILSNVLGENGIRMQSKVKLQRGDRLNDPLNKAIEDLWKRWQNPDYCDVRGILAWPDMERLALRSLIESGEVLVRKVPQRFEDSPVPFSLQIIESDQLADDYSLNLKPHEGNVIKMGVELNKWERPVAYWVYPYHPGDQLLYNHERNRSQPVRVPKSELLHIYVCDRPGQTRGVPWFAAAINRLRHMGGYEEAEIIKARAHACAMGFIQSPESGSFGEDKGDGGKKQLGFEAGTIHTLEPGETFNGFAPTSPNQGLDPFLRFMLRGVAAGIGVPSDALSMDYSQTTYGGQRAAMLDARDYWGVIQQWLSSTLHQKVFEEWLNQAVYSNALSLPGYEADKRWYNHPAWMPRGWSWIDPSKDVNASIAAITNGLSTLGRELAAQGLDFDELVEDRRREVDLLKKAKIAVEIYPETMPEPPAPEAGGAGVDETPPVAPKEGLQAVRSTDEWVQYFSAELDKDENFGKRDLILDHWANCLVSGQFSELTERSIDLAKPEQPSTDEKEMNITLNVNIDGVSRSVDVADQPRGFAYGLTPIRPWEGMRAAKKCKAKPCGNTCIATSKACLQGLTPAQKKLAQAAGKAINSGTAPVSSPIAANPAMPIPPAAASTQAQQPVQSSQTQPKTVGASQTVVDLRAAIDSVDFDELAKHSEVLYAAGKQNASDLGINFNHSIYGGNGTTDPLMNVVLKEAGFNEPPTAISKKDMAALDPKQNLIMYRNPSQANFDARFDQFKNDPDYTSGRGIYCSGTYVAAAYTGSKSSDASAVKAASGYGNGTMKMAYDKSDLKMVKGTDLTHEQQLFSAALSAERTRRVSQIPVTQSDIDSKLIEFNSQKVSTSKSFSFKNGKGDHEVYSVTLKDPVTKQYTTFNNSITKDTGRQGTNPKPWSAKGSNNYYATRREAINELKSVEAKRQAVTNTPEYKKIEKQYEKIKAVVFGDDASGSSGRFAVLKGYDFVRLDQAYDPTYGLLLNRSKIKIQDTKYK